MILLAICTLYMCLQAHAQSPEKSGAALAGKDADTTKTSVRDTVLIEEVEINTGYQRIPKERATGSFVFVDSALLNRTFSTDILSRLEGVVSGLLFHRENGASEPDIDLRGISTLQSNPAPLIIVDNFEFHGDLTSINPNDVMNVTILKDAAAHSIWGAKAGNGVIVITTNSGIRNGATKLSVKSNVSIRAQPNLFATPRISSADFVDLEIQLYKLGHFTNTLTNINKPAISPVVSLLENAKAGKLSSADSIREIDRLKRTDTRRAISKYLERTELSQQYSLSLRGGGRQNAYFASVGLDHSLQQQRGNDQRRLTINLKNNYSAFKDKLSIVSSVLYAHRKNHENAVDRSLLRYPYLAFLDDQRNEIALDQYRTSFLDTVGQGRLLDWRFRPLEEMTLANQGLNQLTLNLNTSLEYNITKALCIGVYYQYGINQSNASTHNTLQSYRSRDLINQFTYFNEQGQAIYPVPMGGILRHSMGRLHSNQVRGMLSLSEQVGNHEFSGILGAEINSAVTQRRNSIYYGYDIRRETSIPVDHVNTYTSTVTGRKNLKIPASQGMSYLTDRFVSFFANGSYLVNKRYGFTASVRRDATNLIGVDANQKWNPLWSVGGSWTLSNETFYDMNQLPYLKLRLTYGSSGNVDRSVSSHLIAMASITNIYNEPTMRIRNPPNPNLKWETVSMLNAGVDFSILKSNLISGSIEYYRKWGSDLMGNAEMPGSSGLTSFRGNNAALMGTGIDLSLNTRVGLAGFLWEPMLLYSYTTNTITQYLIDPPSNGSYVNGAYREGYPREAVFAYRWAGLSATTGAPQGYLNENVSTNYAGIINLKDQEQLIYLGSYKPTHFGSIINTLRYRNISISFNIGYKLNYHFRRRSVNYASLARGEGSSAPDYQLRWQLPGDEQRTQVPAFIYPANALSDEFYAKSEVLVERGDHIRLQDCRLSYRHGIVDITLAGSNLGVLWKENKYGIDPDFLAAPLKPLWTVAINCLF